MEGKSFGSYQLTQLIAKGGMAHVYLAKHARTGRQVAVKVLPAVLMMDDTFLARFTRETQIITNLQHPHILPVFDFGEENGQPYIVMAYMPGGTITDLIQQNPKGMPLDQTVRLVERIAEGLDYAHRRGVIHRDFKPSNVLLDEDNNPYITDFGIAKAAAETSSLTATGRMVGTPYYMAPELARQGGATELADVYALGVTTYQMLTGRTPYEADTPMGILMAHATLPIPDIREMRPDLPEDVTLALTKALDKNPDTRTPSASALAKDLSATASAVDKSNRRAAQASIPAPVAPKPSVVAPLDALTTDVEETSPAIQAQASTTQETNKPEGTAKAETELAKHKLSEDDIISVKLTPKSSLKIGKRRDIPTIIVLTIVGLFILIGISAALNRDSRSVVEIRVTQTPRVVTATAPSVPATPIRRATETNVALATAAARSGITLDYIEDFFDLRNAITISTGGTLIPDNTDDFLEVTCKNVSIANGGIAIDFYRIPQAAQFGLLFRDERANEQYRLVFENVTQNGRWKYALVNGLEGVIDSGGIETEDDEVGINIKVIMDAAEGWLIVDDRYVYELDLSDRLGAGDVCVATDIFGDIEAEDPISYRQFRVFGQ